MNRMMVNDSVEEEGQAGRSLLPSMKGVQQLRSPCSSPSLYSSFTE